MIYEPLKESQRSNYFSNNTETFIYFIHFVDICADSAKINDVTVALAWLRAVALNCMAIVFLIPLHSQYKTSKHTTSSNLRGSSKNCDFC